MSEFTPGAERALESAACWATRANASDLRLPEMLLGLLAEPECRAALILTRAGVDETAVRSRWPELTMLEEAERRRGPSPELAAAVGEAEQRLFEYPQPLQLATEHLLLGIVAAPSEAADWLRERGLDPAELEAEMHRLAGHQPGPLAWEEGEKVVSGQWSVVSGEKPETLFAASLATRSGDTEDIPVNPREELSLLRIIDAAANRASEGLRVVEDYVRFVLDDRHLTEQLKLLRHELAQTLSGFPSELRHAARETLTDVGTSVTCETEQVRTDAAAVATAAFKRLEQSLRSLEEFAKPLDPPTAAVFEQLRYRTYTLERAVDITRTSLDRLAGAQLYVLLDGRPTVNEFRTLVESLVQAGVHAIQLRDKHLPDRELLERARLLRELTAASATLFIMNDRPDLAVLAGADGVHVGQDELSVKDARTILGPRGLIGVSTHNLEQARRAVLEGANCIGVGPTFPSGTKQFAAFTGPDLLRAVGAEVRLPAFAIGGINAANLAQVLAAGFTRIAVSAAVTAAGDPAANVKELLGLLSAKPIELE